MCGSKYDRRKLCNSRPGIPATWRLTESSERKAFIVDYFWICLTFVQLEKVNVRVSEEKYREAVLFENEFLNLTH